ncbi:MAG TPA: low affinity iron permease family protein [Xanthobacteraceae bacterium]|nr:low affinity iron permease family protein [Xanthobacteraceae bacterium]
MAYNDSNHSRAKKKTPVARFFDKPDTGLSWFGGFAQATSKWAGKPLTFLICVALVVVWAATGPLFHYSDTWQLVINTSTTIVTFLMVFLIQNTQNRDSLAFQIKLSELVIAMKGAPNSVASIEELSDVELEELQKACHRHASETSGRAREYKKALATRRRGARQKTKKKA